MSLGWELEKIGSGVVIFRGEFAPPCAKFAKIRAPLSRLAFRSFTRRCAILTSTNPTRFLGRLPAIFGPFAGPKVHQIRRKNALGFQPKKGPKIVKKSFKKIAGFPG